MKWKAFKYARSGQMHNARSGQMHKVKFLFY